MTPSHIHICVHDWYTYSYLCCNFLQVSLWSNIASLFRRACAISRRPPTSAAHLFPENHRRYLLLVEMIFVGFRVFVGIYACAHVCVCTCVQVYLLRCMSMSSYISDLQWLAVCVACVQAYLLRCISMPSHNSLGFRVSLAHYPHTSCWLPENHDRYW